MGLVELSVSVVMRVLTLFLPSGDAIPALAFLHIDQYGDATTLNVSWIAPKNVSVTVCRYSTHKAFKHVFLPLLSWPAVMSGRGSVFVMIVRYLQENFICKHEHYLPTPTC